jgi:2-polyprenyl-3-methyl-5-hydroxy-6-metoxy-1,4-benzoquinol methylase
MPELEQAITELKSLRTDIEETENIKKELVEIKTTLKEIKAILTERLGSENLLEEVKKALAKAFETRPTPTPQQKAALPSQPVQPKTLPVHTDADKEDITSNNFDEDFYIQTYPDIKQAIANGQIRSAWQHYVTYGRKENRKYRLLRPDPEREFEKLKTLLYSDRWPKAADTQYICKNEPGDFVKRAKGIIDLMIEEPIQNKKFLDFGCGAGYIPKMAGEEKKTTLAVGYDLVTSTDLAWETETNGWLLTTNYENVAAKGPYDVILLYDVLDHSENAEDIMAKVEQLLAPGGSVYVRCHPWCGRHGGHLYQQLNKAFVHVIFSEEELARLNMKPEKIRRTTQPFVEYEKLFKATKLSLKSQIPIRNTVEDFFKDEPIVSSRVEKLYKIATTAQWPDFQLSQTFIDYHLTKPK